MRYASLLLLIFMWLGALSGCGDTPSPREALPTDGTGLFTLLPPSQTGVSFQNVLTEGLNTNILMYEYFYNGGGVAAGDFNGDGLIDLYFSANMGDNQLYLNEGDLRFREVTEAAGVGGRPGPWKTGVTAVDINGDARLDLYLCYSGALPADKRDNQLFINQGNDANGVPQFKEQAAAYGLASTAYSNQGYFFDYDRDGDLDMLLLNHNPKNLPILNESRTAQLLQQDDPEQGIRLFRQDDGRFQDVTVQAGISGTALTYGLGIGIADLDADGWPDFYVSNDYTVPDYLYHNNGDGTFSNQLPDRIRHNSQFSMGNDVGDVNNDGLTDIITLDMLPEDNRRQKLLMAPDNYAKFEQNVRNGFHYQFMRNMLQLNNGDGTFSEIGQWAGMSNTDWSWSALLADYDNDGWKDLYITNGYFRDYTNMDFIKYMNAFVGERGRLQREDVLALIEEMPASNVNNYLFANTGEGTFANRTEAWGLARPSNSNGAAYADLDNDGDLDLVVNNINQPAFIYRNDGTGANQYLQFELAGNAPNTQGIGAQVRLWYAGQEQVLAQFPARGYLSTVSPVLHAGLGETKTLDSLEVIWPGGAREVRRAVATGQRLTLREADAQRTPGRGASPAQPLFAAVAAPLAHQDPARLPFWQDFDRQPLLIRELSYAGPCMASGDVNGDGRPDVVIGGGQGQPLRLYVQRSDGRLVEQPVAAWAADAAAVDVALALFDANGDGALDLYAGSGGYHDLEPQDPRLVDRLYLNDGRGGFTRATEAIPALRVATGAVALGDADGDGDPDLFVGGRVTPGRYPEAPVSYLLLNDGQGTFAESTAQLAPEMADLGMVTAAAWADLDRDGRQELVVAGEWMALKVFAAQGDLLRDRTGQYFDRPYRGWWNTLALADVNGDGYPDLVAGNHGTNSQVKASPEAPAELFYDDFDENGSVDPLLTTYIQGQRYPYLTRDELLEQLAYLRDRYTSYAAYADEGLEGVLGAEALKKAGHLTADHLETTLFLNEGGARFRAMPLPQPAQYAPVHVIAVWDADGDGHQDLLLCGNDHHYKLRLGQMDANYGVLLRGDGQGGFGYVPQPQAGFCLKGEVRSLLRLDQTLLFGINGGPVTAYRRQ